jgi:uncharacterized protein YybS (DUF2232 family)
MTAPVSASAHERREPGAESVLGAAVGSALLFAGRLLVPVLFPLAMVSPFPLLVLRLRGGLGSALAAASASAALLAAVFSPGTGLAFLLLLAVPTLIMVDTMARGRGLLRGCAWAFAVVALELGAALLFANERMSAVVLDPFDYYASPQFIDEVRGAGVPAEQVEAWAEQFAALSRVMAVVYPAAWLILGALVVLANSTLLRLYLARRDPAWLEGNEFERLRWPFAMAVLFVLSGLAVLAPALRPAAYNVLLLLAFFFALQGLAVVAFYTRRLAAPPFLRWAVMVLVLVNPWAAQILGLLGLFDMWFDFRKWAEPPPAAQA